MTRFLDISIAIIAIVTISPLFLILIIILNFTGEKEIFFYHERIGRYQKKFKLIKFATMLKNSPQIGSKDLTIPNDPRVLRFGTILRKTKLNELPQLFNIIKGDMSFVGPRPLTSKQIETFDKNKLNVILKNKPGLTGIGSIIFNDEEKILSKVDNHEEFYNKIILPYKEELEYWYTKNNHAFSYLFFIIFTIFILFIPNKRILWFIFKSLPQPNEHLKNII